jgi:hypothetical protein
MIRGHNVDLCHAAAPEACADIADAPWPGRQKDLVGPVVIRDVFHGLVRLKVDGKEVSLRV